MKVKRKWAPEVGGTTHAKKKRRSEKDKRGKGSLACSICDYRAARKSHLTEHMRTHTGDKPYACTKCDYRATQKNTLTAHMRTHTGDKPYACTKCAYRAATKSNLTRHMCTHTGDKPYACTKCAYRAARKSNFTKHMKRKHNITPIIINARRIRRCSQPFTLFEIKEFATLAESLSSVVHGSRSSSRAL